jgi:pimeloyl-ACP methyl ester carboxylesterase
MKNLLLCFCFCCLSCITLSAQKHHVYLIAGQGSDSAIFQNFTWDSTQYEIVHVVCRTPKKNELMRAYSHDLITQIDTSQKFSLIGVSLGGMLAVELTAMIHPEKTIIISSAKSAGEIPWRYRFMKRFKAYNAISPRRYKKSSSRVQGVVEPDRNNNERVFKEMLARKDPLFLKRATHMIVQWDRKELPKEIIHIHGTDDHTLPIRFVNPTFVIENGSHMMTLTRSEEIFEIILREMTKEADTKI